MHVQQNEMTSIQKSVLGVLVDEYKFIKSTSTMISNKNSLKMAFVTGGCFFTFTTKVSKEPQSVSIIRF